ncbi:BNR repeat-like domain-containing protein [Fodinibius roseus]|uniref:exo-alpha-sialidase n=1 Tax=Fodinibius roseus TaxID=1194090 RepID=A0A1M5LG01_9BACT|nr:sialidase family protein [Fodinibius roseus]SHG63886.1 BNR repeat-like domain-containing protein [Fodinibius roseus]
MDRLNFIKKSSLISGLSLVNIPMIFQRITPNDIPAAARKSSALHNAQKVEKVRDFIIYEDPRFYSSFPSVINKGDGEIVVAFRRAPDRTIFGEEKTHHVDPNSYLVTVTSNDYGESWTEEPALLYAHPFGGSQDPCLLQLQDGRILCTSYGWAFVNAGGIENLRTPNFKNAGRSVFLGGYYLKSADGGETWDGPFYPPNIPPEVKYSALGNPLPAYNRGALWEGESGRLFWVVAAGDDPDNIGKTSTHLLISDDKGETWQYSCPVAEDDKASFNEASVYETPKGDLVAFLRTSGLDDQAVIARSADGGESFGPWQTMGFRGHPLQALRLPDNRVFLVYGYRHKPYGIRARILNEECTDFNTAPEIVIRRDGGSSDIGYPWSVMLDENRILVTYYFNVNNDTRHIAGTILELKG